MCFSSRIGFALLFFALLNSAGLTHSESIAISADPPPRGGSEATRQAPESPTAIGSGRAGYLYAALPNQNRLCRIWADGRTRLAEGSGSEGSGPVGTSSVSGRLDRANAISLDSLGSLYLTEENNSRIRGLTYGGIIRTVAGTGIYGFSGDGGPASSAQVRGSEDVEVDRAGNLYIADTSNGRVRMVTPGGIINTVSGTGTQGFNGDGGPAASAWLAYPRGVAVDTAGNLYIADFGNERIRMVESYSGITTCFPQVAVGGGFTTVVTLGNAGSDSLSGTLALWDQQGKPLAVDGSLEDPVSHVQALRSHAFPVSIPAGGVSFLTISPLSPGDPTTSGWAQFQSLGGSPYGVAAYKFVVSGSLQSVAGVLPSPTMQSATIPVDDDLSLSRFTGYAIANPGVSTIQIDLVEVSVDGKTASALDPIVLGPGEQKARFLFQDPKAAADFKGTAVLSGKDGAAFTAVALVQVQCATGPVYTVIPVLPAKAPNLPHQ